MALHKISTPTAAFSSRLIRRSHKTHVFTMIYTLARYLLFCSIADRLALPMRGNGGEPPA